MCEHNEYSVKLSLSHPFLMENLNSNVAEEERRLNLTWSPLALLLNARTLCYGIEKNCLKYKAAEFVSFNNTAAIFPTTGNALKINRVD